MKAGADVFGVVGAGVMGSGLAQTLAASGATVRLVDVDDETLDRSRERIRKGLRLGHLWGSGTRGEPIEAVLDRIEPCTDLDRLADAGFVIENATEDREIKAGIWARLDRVCAPDVVLAANTSAIPITWFGSRTARPDQVVGMHFMNPVPLKPMVEVIRGVHTSEATLVRAKQVVAFMGKECLVVEDSPGFVTNRVAMLAVNEAAFLVQEGVASIETIDRLFRTCFAHKMGPLETADTIGIDTVLYSIQGLHRDLGESKYRPCTLLQKMVDAGHLGRKSGRGFYRYVLPQGEGRA